MSDKVATFMSQVHKKSAEHFKVMPCPLYTLNGNQNVLTWTSDDLKQFAETLKDGDEVYMVVPYHL